MSWVVLIVGLGFSVFAGSHWRSAVQQDGAETFRRASIDAAGSIGTTIHRVADLTASTSAFLAARPDVNNAEFGQWFERLGGHGRHPSVIALALIEKVSPAELPAYFERLRRDPRWATTAFAPEVVPPGDRPQYCFASARIITDASLDVPPNVDVCAVVEGLSYNKDRVAGDSDLTFVKFTLPPVEGKAEPREWLAVSTHDEAYQVVPATFAGRTGLYAVASVVDLDAVIADALGERSDLAVSLLYHPSGHAWERLASFGEQPSGDLFRQTVPFIAEDEWRLEVTAPAAMFDRSADKQGLVLGAGLGLAFLLVFFLIRVLAGSRAKALTLVDARTADLGTSEARFRLLASSAPIGVAYGDVDGRCVFVNDRLATILDRPAGDIYGSGWQSSLGADDRAKLRDLRQDEAIELEVTATGRWLRVRNATLPDGGGHVTSVEDVSDEVAAREMLRYESRHDGLTGLPNRVSIVESLGRGIDDIADVRGQLAVVFIDLDRFKQVNDVYGHAAGDELLAQAGLRLARAVRPGDIAARLGGDEFAVMMPGVEDQASLVSILFRIESTLCAPYDVMGAQVVVGASIGVVMVDDKSEDAESVLRDADMAMYRAKQGSGRFEIFDASLRESLFARVETERALRAALDHQELVVHYQPILAMDGETTVGAEALLRWEHPRRGLLPPADFLPIAESTGLIVPIGDWVLRTAMEMAATWPAHVVLSVNVSAQQLAASEVLADLGPALAQAGISADRLCIEILESHLVDDSIVDRIATLKELGVKIAIDDFGTGFNSLVNLKRFQVDSIKIDRSFIEGLSESQVDLAIVSKLVELAHMLDVTIVAEGVEHAEQARVLRAAGCDHGQGFLWAPALPAADLERQFLGDLTRADP